ncbi:MAG TPA: zinc finger domain-containing protein [Caldisericia bacterium]|nr:zinc finger domain-containing protein [Caldisericia bacterium]
MFELPETLNISKQINQTLLGKTIQKGSLGNSPHKFVWYNQSHEMFESLSHHKTIATSYVLGSWLMIPLEPSYILVLGEFGGKLLYHPQGSKVPSKYHLLLSFTDGSILTETVQLWGAIELYEKGKELERPYIKDMKISPNHPAFTLSYFHDLVKESISHGNKSVKSLLAQDQTIPGIGNSSLQDILFHAGLHPKFPIKALSRNHIDKLYYSLIKTIQSISELGGRSEEVDLFGKAGKYERILSSKTQGKPCPNCNTTIEKIAYLGGSCYFCPHCQKLTP